MAKESAHIPVLLEETIDGLALSPSDIVVDGTMGGGGHARVIVDRLSKKGMYIGIDLDAEALARVEARLSKADPTVVLVEDNYRNIDRVCKNIGVTSIDKFVIDLGLSSDQLEVSGRGFTFSKEEPLGMTFNTTPGPDATTAYDAVNHWSEESLADVIYGFGEDPFARRIARKIVEAREAQAIETTHELSEVIASAYPGRMRHGRTHPATRTFQALRMAVNDELGSLEEGLRKVRALLSPHGRIAVISFESISDRMVKRLFLEFSKEGDMRLITKKPLTPSESEIRHNPRSRSAKLRIIEKI